MSQRVPISTRAIPSKREEPKRNALVADQDPRLLQERTGDRQALSLTSGELRTPRAHLGLKTMRQSLDKAAVGEPCNFFNLGAGSIRSAVGNCEKKNDREHEPERYRDRRNWGGETHCSRR